MWLRNSYMEEAIEYRARGARTMKEMILVVEDNPDMTAQLRLALEMEGYRFWPQPMVRRLCGFWRG